jgi:hypothetical protein
MRHCVISAMKGAYSGARSRTLIHPSRKEIDVLVKELGH